MGLFSKVGAVFANPQLVLGGAALAGDFLGQRDANRRNVASAREQMAFQERMSNTSHQREVADLELAGMNPVLTAGGSGASSPVGSSATQESESPDYAKYASTAIQYQNMKKMMSEADARIRYTNAQTDAIETGMASKFVGTKIAKQWVPRIEKISKMMSGALAGDHSAKAASYGSKIGQNIRKGWKGTDKLRIKRRGD